MTATSTGEEVGALLSQPVLLSGALSRLTVVVAFEQLGLDQLAQACRGRRLAQAGSPREAVEAGGAVESLPEDEQR
jgi:hypothetical protein